MGVDFGDSIPREKIQLEDIAGWTLAVDGYNTLYQFLAIIRGMDGGHLKDAQGRVTSHISGLFYRNVNLLELGMKLVYVFDGRPPELKMEEIRRRSEQRREAKDQYLRALQAGEMTQARKYAEASTVLRRDMVSDAKALLDAMGIPWVDAPSEGEAQASVMAIEGTVNAVASQDHDSIVFGAPVLVRNVTVSGKRRLPSKGIVINVVPERITLESALTATGLSREQLVDFAILLGTDFNPDGFAGVGPATALKYLKKYGRLEEIKELAGPLQGINYPEIRKLYLDAPSVKGVRPEWKPLDKERVVSFLVGEHSFSRDRVDAAIARVQSSKADSHQTETLEKWFG
ncbi:MAG: flap endonuclease-1 [Nitrososphaerota archaeon]|jgi:flap endonuclease-1|nr:flap endonuclease-1 [Nitrososphaerota archaeon]MCL5672191.1 flap endonuclease-1 [Nitrososphaerota archaeon]MDG6903514.1 flap endonuclease-1 [Nitrososphaerota archaeon]MDG6912123.1 flap endonuclease-1 [Nitrososphaerota archaeon]MDG6924743.1 flap endonuclease-1 [Nitrososphaerota archaeon]